MTERGNDWKLDKGLEESSGGAELEYRVVRIFRKNALFRRTPKPTTKLGWYHNIKYDTDYQYTHHGSRHVLLSSGKETTMSCKATCRKLVGTCRDLSEVVGSCRKLSEVVGSCRKLSEVVGSCRKLSEACWKSGQTRPARQAGEIGEIGEIGDKARGVRHPPETLGIFNNSLLKSNLPK
jgi:hypothetical protein